MLLPHRLRLLRVFTDVSRLASLPTTELHADAGVLAAEAAPRLVATAFPQLESLTVWYAAGVDEALTAALQQLLGTGAGGEAQEALLPRLRYLSIHRLGTAVSDYAPLPPALAASLRGATQLRLLRLDFKLRRSTLAESLAPLVGLESLQLGKTSAPFLSTLLQPLTALTALRFSLPGVLRPDAGLSSLTRLAELTVAEATIDVSTLSRLGCLTKLECGALCAPGPAGAAGPGPIAAAARTWDLPPQLAEVKLTSQPPEALPALRAPKALARWDVFLALKEGTHYGEDGALLPEAEAALCRAAGMLGSADPDMVVTVEGRRLLPVGGRAEVGPGRRNHTPWLEAVRQAGVASLELNGIALSHQDMETLSRCTALKALGLGRTSYPPSALPKLGRLPALECLGLDCGSWVAEAAGAGPVLEPPPRITGALLALCADDRWAGRKVEVRLYHDPALSNGVKAQLASVVTSLQEELRGLGVDGKRLRLEAYV
ncbi:hypothetical protein HYH03_018195 [Edaphochlamys debaryana]|uniref:Uncharacterized protein n=1 Tax=Edaphochlamys debaryana TaxID=47281 RepID=A0A835XIH0_9CHLO|nr:hypothetical protein HYH03_018195 [Edaphochlamys debaryana]|eukprot:KAG2482916.1 hypothetical protein HYH03_018195 [Edaphochlamys debaryana]